jgi:hypothetical protein
MNSNEMIQMACAEVGIPVLPADGYTTKYFTTGLDDEAVAMTRKACALVQLSVGKPLMTCITHRYTKDAKRCLKVTVTEVLRNPAMECGAP